MYPMGRKVQSKSQGEPESDDTHPDVFQLYGPSLFLRADGRVSSRDTPHERGSGVQQSSV